MKKNILLLFLVVVIPSVAQENDDEFRPLAVEGRIWNYNRIVEWDNSHWPLSTHAYSYMVTGDTIIGGIGYKKLYRNDYTFPHDEDNMEWWTEWHSDDGYIDNDWHYVAALRDDGPKAYILRDGKTEEEMIYDFTLEKGDVVEFNHATITIDLAYTINSHNLTLQKRGIYWKGVPYPTSFGDYRVYWIESVGWDIDFFFPDGNIRSIYKGNSNIISVFDGDACIYGDPYTAIRDLSAQPAAGDSGSKFQVSGSKLYDLQGRRLSAPPAKGVYIEDKRVKIRE